MFLGVLSSLIDKTLKDMRHVGWIISGTLTIFLTLILNGNISMFSGIPPLGKLLNPQSGVWANGESSNNYVDENISLDGLDGEIQIVYNKRKVPHIFANTMSDALLAQGYVEARDRQFQLEFIYRFASGQLSEVLGERTIELDKQQRRKGLPLATKNTIRGWQQFPEKFRLIENYVKGMNLWLDNVADKKLPVEFKLIGIPASNWSVEKCAYVQKWMSDVLCGRSSDIEMTNLFNALGEDQFHFLYPDKAMIVDPVIPEEVDYVFDSIYLDPDNHDGNVLIGALKDKYQLHPQGPKNLGSNNWAISKEKSSTGAPIFCNDPHLQLTLPSVWYEIGIHLPDMDSYGVTIPGMPGIMMGFNNHIAWGETNVGQDVKDFKKMKWVDKSNYTYLLDGKEVTADYSVEEIKVKGQESIYDTIIHTYWGPVTYESSQGDNDYAMRWLAHDIPDKPEFMTFLAGLEAKNYNDYLEITSNFITPAQNFAFASKDGDIALRVNGTFPAKNWQEGRFVEDGSRSIYNWESYIPREQNPQVLNPSRGFISSANQRSTDDGYPYYYNGKFEYDRNRSINQYLSTSDELTIEDMKRFQLSNRSVFAEDIVPVLIGLLVVDKLSTTESKYVEELQAWDFHFDKESEIATFFDLWFEEIKDQTFDEIDQLSDSLNIAYPANWRIAEILQDYPDADIFDIKGTPDKEQAFDIVRTSFKSTISLLDSLRESGDDLSWGAYSPLNIRHLARLAPFSEENIEVGGHPDALNAIGNTHGPSWRMIVSLEESTKAYGVFPGGQSGSPFSPFYKTSLEKWIKGEYHELPEVRVPEDINEPLFTVNLKNQ